MRKAIATLAIGKRYESLFHKLALPTWKPYASRHGYEIVCFDRPLDQSERARGRSVAWQKLLVLGQPELAGFDSVVWIDADIAINFRRAPCIVEQTPPDQLGICEETRLPDIPLFEFMHDSIRTLVDQMRREHGLDSGLSVYELNRIAQPPSQLLNTGVMVLRPQHRALLEDVYARYEDAGPCALYEMPALSHEIVRNGGFSLLDPKFNVIALTILTAFGNIYQGYERGFDGRAALVAALLGKVYFLHFAGNQSRMLDLALINLNHPHFLLDMDTTRAAVERDQRRRKSPVPDDQ